MVLSTLKSWKWAGTSFSLKGSAWGQAWGPSSEKQELGLQHGVRRAMPGWGPFNQGRSPDLCLGTGWRTQGRVFLLSSSALPSSSGCSVGKVGWARWGPGGRPKWLRPRRGVGDSWGGVSQWPALSGYFTWKKQIWNTPTVPCVRTVEISGSADGRSSQENQNKDSR